MNTLTIGIAGGTGSGKTTLTDRIVSEFGGDVSILHHDSYYKAHDEMPYEERCRLNYDHPDAFDTPLFVEHLRALRRGEAVDCPVYDYSVHNRAVGTERLQPAKVLVVEGILIFAEPEVCRELDIKIFVDTDADERILRRIIRDVRDRGRSLESVIGQYLTTVKPMHEQFVEPSKRRADLIVPEGGHNAVALEMVIERIRGYLRNEQE
ncbi:MAG: uridine kinase [Oscillospiraceae bacterium]|nr:uridine kinase [Oscillospiraceae bacterium]